MVAQNKTTKGGIFVNWYWTWLVSAAFIVVMAFYFFDRPTWLYYSYRGISLSHEMNYAVWWSGILLFLSGVVFARVGRLAHNNGQVAWVWYVLALAMVALCMDEVGSLHELVSTLGGWLGLLPFALVFALAFGLALIELVRRPELRMSAFLIVLGIGIFATVAGLEALEHSGERVHHLWRKLRLVGEEGSELIAMGILLTAGLLAMRRMGEADASFLSVTSVVEELLDYPLTVFFLLVLNIAIGVMFIVPNYTWFLEGNPLVLFPMLLFFCLGIIARLHARTTTDSGFWLLLGVVCFAASVLQMFNLNIFANQLLQIQVNIFTGPPLSWAVTLVPLALLGWFGLRRGALGPRDLAHALVVLVVVSLMIFPDIHHRYRIEYLYYLFSGTVAYLCFQMIGRLRA